MNKKLSDVLPKEFLTDIHKNTIAYKFKDINIIAEHSSMLDYNSYIGWPGKHKNVFFWVELENGYAVGWNENPGRGWSFPVFKIRE